MTKELKFRQIIQHLIDEINEAKKKSNSIHSAGNIKSSGDEVENLIREKISLFLPEKYLVKQGHIVNSEGKVSNQFDIIIFDRLSTPKFFESKNETVFYPIESVLAVGEIKTTLRSKDLIEFGKKIKYLKVDMKRELIENTVYGGKLKGNSLMSDFVNMSLDRKYKNPLFSFIFAIDAENVNNLEIDESYSFMPNDVYILNYGLYKYGYFNNNKMKPKIEDESPIMDTWIEIKKPGIVCLAMMFNQLIDHLNMCRIEPFSISNYMSSSEDFIVNGSEIIVRGPNKEK